MGLQTLIHSLECNPVITAVPDNRFAKALMSPAEVIFCLEASILTLAQRIAAAHEQGKFIFIHLDLAEGLGRDRAALEFLQQRGADGIITTKSHLVRSAKELGLITVQRFFTLDTKGLGSMQEAIASAKPDLIEIMPGIVPKIIRRFAGGAVPVIAGGLIETKQEVTEALSAGALAVSTGKEELWYL